ncbi:glutamine--fructose-6-phosphate transaminase (isomerizing) [Candidatus Sumerlaeota bacterium]|nr:glutamine--fructose-6-phosphate transaminase (isomerizing) [Candidatus Sumerlaeota bacterium]
MCGIVGYVGKRQASGICLDGLKRLEYRGYDSAGISVLTEDGQLNSLKTVGKLSILCEALQQKPLSGALGIGHTRWATHGRPSQENSHPHISGNSRIAVVHNGIIENYQELREGLIRDGVKFASQTDSETMAHLVQKHYDGDLREAVCRAVRELHGAFAFGVICADSPGQLVAVRRFSPLVVGIGEGENFIASDMGAIRKETDKVYVIDDNEVASLTAEGVELTGLDGAAIEREVFVIPWPAEAAEKGGHKHFMHKEIHEQPDTIRACLTGRVASPDRPIMLDGLGLSEDEIRNMRRVVFTACGTAYHAGMTGRFLMEKLARIPSEVDLAAELRDRDPMVLDHTLCVVISQSGETADTLAALRSMKEKGAKILAVLNVVDSSIARESDGVIYIQAGPEIGVASTKCYTSQTLTLTMLALYFSQVRGTLTEDELRSYRQELLRLPESAKVLLAREDAIREVALKHYERTDALYLARGVNVPSAMEGALKMKEISYIHAEGYSAGEMKHGPIALIEPKCFTVAIAIAGEVYEKMIGNIMEIKARSGPMIVVATDGDARIPDAGVDPHAESDDFSAQPNDMVWVPPMPEMLSPILLGIPLQLLSYHTADLRGKDIDQPRNLAKTVTVE